MNALIPLGDWIWLAMPTNLEWELVYRSIIKAAILVIESKSKRHLIQNTNFSAKYFMLYQPIIQESLKTIF